MRRKPLVLHGINTGMEMILGDKWMESSGDRGKTLEGVACQCGWIYDENGPHLTANDERKLEFHYNNCKQARHS